VSEWLDLMLDEIARKQREAREAEEELRRRAEKDSDKMASSADQSK